jgi:hypothetical protein
MALEKELGRLQDDFATIDLLTRRSDPAVVEILLKRSKSIALRMDANLNHQRPHLHIDYGKERHSASYAIDSGQRLAGKLAHKYDRKIAEFIDNNRLALNKTWTALREGQDAKLFICQLTGDGFE